MKFYTLAREESIEPQTHANNIPENFKTRNLYTLYNEQEIDWLEFDSNIISKDVLSNFSVNLHGIIISKKFHDCILELNITGVQFIEVKSNTVNGYKLMLFNNELTSKIDYENSRFTITEINLIADNKTTEAPTATNAKNTLKLYNEEVAVHGLKSLRPSDGYQFNKGFNIGDEDIFRIGHFDKSFYFSKKAKDLIERNGLTGFEFIESPYWK
jgi:hypothetical protein